MQILKQALRKQVASHHEGQPTLTIEHRLTNLLFRNRNTPHTVIGVPLTELLLKRQPHIRFSNLLPSVEKQVNAQQAKQKLYHDRCRWPQKVLNILDESTASQYATREQTSVFPEKSSQLRLSPEKSLQSGMSSEKSSQLRVFPEKLSQSRVSPEKSSQSCVSSEKSSQLRVFPEKLSQSRVSPEKSSQSCVSSEKPSQLRVSPDNSSTHTSVQRERRYPDRFRKAPKRLDV